MKHVHIKAFDVPDAWWQALKRIWEEGEIFTVGYGSEQTETKKLNLTIEILNPSNRPLLSDKAPNDMKYLNWYAGTYLYYPEPDDAEYTYGNRMRKPVDQLQEVINRFKQEKMDRQCTVIIRRPEDIVKGKCKDPPCLTVIDFEIIDGKLSATSYFRSWDAYGGLPCNIAGLVMIFEFMAKEIGVELGNLVFHSKNCHIYKRQYALVESLFHTDKNSFTSKMFKPDEKSKV